MIIGVNRPDRFSNSNGRILKYFGCDTFAEVKQFSLRYHMVYKAVSFSLLSAINWIFGVIGVFVLAILLMLGYKLYKRIRERNQS